MLLVKEIISEFSLKKIKMLLVSSALVRAPGKKE